MASYGGNIRKVEGNKQIGFTLETGNAVRVLSELFRQHFDRYIPPELLILGLINLARAPLSYFLHDSEMRKCLADLGHEYLRVKADFLICKSWWNLGLIICGWDDVRKGN
jgi:hypothetical protein